MIKYVFFCFMIVIAHVGYAADKIVTTETIPVAKTQLSYAIPGAPQHAKMQDENSMYDENGRYKSYGCCTSEYCSYYYPTCPSFFYPNEQVLKRSANAYHPTQLYKT